MSDKSILDQYQYSIRDNQIARMPAFPRDHSRLLVYNTEDDSIHLDYFYHLANYLPYQSLMIMNNTGVIPARVLFTKDTGGKVEGLILINEGLREDGTIPVIVNKKIHVGRQLWIADFMFDVIRQENQYFYLLPRFSIELLSEILLKYGTTPTPKYLGKLDLDEEEVRARYQTIFADEKRSVAAPTASLHFTEEVFKTLNEKRIEVNHVTLHVGMGTFASVTKEQIDSGKLHTEPIRIKQRTKQKIQQAKGNAQKVIAVGTTAIRVLESQADWILKEETNEDLVTRTNLFIMPGYEFKVADILITNFHVPQSSLMALVDAFLMHKKSKRRILELYNLALENDFRFFSFGDSMVIL